ncbi:NAD(P)-dependent oxidoreductase [Hoeflea sp. YIM 152468]|uniref:NAD-dependent epimerase/dehydratase family protein n=1 Tax=Hoeflea sp. YIM 152468 TaxID=3031759 RepID=UPI0023DAA412|nr:NAD(P)-dependent oxidoreductase [Hoeflea sp. YIM 152468]MDF1607948.1 NAD(P)-dependent oxidoreductase [Hoeflea sp. YIM 152468]
MKVLVSGGTGLVGRYIVETLSKAGCEVLVAGRTPPASGLFSKPVDFRAARLDPHWKPDALFDAVDVFIHAAFEHLPGQYRGGEGDDPDGFRRSNLLGTINFFDAAKRMGVQRAIFLSSRAVYDGVASGTRLTEPLEVRPTSLYGEIKLLGEQALAALNAPGFTTSSLRLTGVYGDLRPNKWDGLFADYLAGHEIPVRAGSEVHGRDVGQAVQLMLATDPARVGGKAFNVSDVIADTHDILSLYKAATSCRHPLPLPADKSAVAAMATDRIRSLGWKPGGMALLRETLEHLAVKAQT